MTAHNRRHAVKKAPADECIHRTVYEAPTASEDYVRGICRLCGKEQRGLAWSDGVPGTWREKGKRVMGGARG